ncbi:MAG: holo-ACP synthase [Alphaproteobacteria bacterium]|nr:holo-ACP synthase [Alphaproteobacteria bacterium]
MILGIGTDLCHLARMAQSHQRFGERLLNRIYTDYERDILQTRSQQRFINRLAMFWAAKEACMKAIGTGMRQGVTFKQIEVRHQKTGKPYLAVSGATLAHAQRLTPQGMDFIFHVSLTDEWIGNGVNAHHQARNNLDYVAHAMVILEAIPIPTE